ncbi:hypothetical protein HVPorG_04238 [Roseomonas mucosa]|uniref:Uncharacterized protein n=1 Tax=Roseomonas mucosa TaxID=207340 RepID=A0A4Y1MW69_9PROT|nr:hypothetical protein RADP37_04238 [Roseomonas mucosa]QDD94330.1 hypothetical protein HVIM_04238 [Roseomonas mucosa]QDD99438.1 hypothetical protein ADP8_04238 [Roseomonas mucosa]QDJ09151.1 hypothetical protein HVPorG_04238 [Roseomonas mucosa]
MALMRACSKGGPGPGAEIALGHPARRADPLNLIRVMPAKGQERAATGRDMIP